MAQAKLTGADRGVSPVDVRSTERGFSLVEVLMAMAILMIVSLGVAQLFAAGTRLNMIARGQTSTTMLAQQKMEQIRSLTWGYDSAGRGTPVSDLTSNLAQSPATQTGAGLSASPTYALRSNVDGLVDFLDASGAWVGTGATPPPTAAYIRRWSIQPLPGNADNTLVIQVLTTTVANEASRPADQRSRSRLPGDTLLVSVKTRKAS